MGIIEIAKIIEYNASKVIENITSEMIEPYIYIQTEYKKSDVSANKTFQNIFCKYYQINIDEAGQEYINNYFQCLEKYKNPDKIDVEQICVALSYTKDSNGKYQPINYKNVSCFLNLLNNQFTVWHEEFLKMFGIPQPYFLDTGKEIRYFQLSLIKIYKEFDEIMRLNLLPTALRLFDEKYPDAGISIEKKLEFLFLAFDRINFLDVLFPEEDKILDEDSISLN
ncbi:MAG TPA: hypothetical protein VI413_11585 [Paludibacter sp.]